ncbi:MAG: FAD-dependent oxidoreductase [Opitutales bacterium]
MSKKIVIIGGGPAGITAAYKLVQLGHQVEIFEASGQVGGLSRTIDLWDQKVDLGPHRFFSKDSRINATWFEVVGEDYQTVNRLTRIYYNGAFYHYPLKPVSALFTMGPFQAWQCLLSYARSRLSKAGEGDTFEDWVISRFGRRLYEMFFKAYSEKLWGIPCAELDKDFAAQRIKKFSLGEALKTALGWSGQQHNTLVDSFAYPNGGSGMVYERMARYIESHGGRIVLNTPIRKVCLEGDRVTGVELEDGRFQSADAVVSTMPLSLMVASLFEPPAPELQEALDALRYRNTLLVYLKVDREDLFQDQWIYCHSEDVGFGRITNFRNWVPTLYGQEQGSILALEYWCNPEDALWAAPHDEIIARAEQDLRKTGLIGEARIEAGKVIPIPRCYPVYQVGYAEQIQTIMRHLEPIQNLVPIGRYGSFKYNNQDHSILMGLLAAENIDTGSRKHDLWAVNTDYDAYQEERL